MDREKKIYLCVRSLLNVSNDLKEDYVDFSNMILFIADKIAEHEQNREKKDNYILHGNGRVHDLSCECDETCQCDETCTITQDDTKYNEEMNIEKEIDEMISTVRKEMQSVSD